jgi:hypothetical protein
VNELESGIIPLLEKEGWMRDQENREATLVRADGVVRSAKSLGLKSFAELLLRLRPIGLALRVLRLRPIGACASGHPVCGASEASRLCINAAGFAALSNTKRSPPPESQKPCVSRRVRRSF